MTEDMQNPASNQEASTAEAPRRIPVAVVLTLYKNADLESIREQLARMDDFMRSTAFTYLDTSTTNAYKAEHKVNSLLYFELCRRGGVRPDGLAWAPIAAVKNWEVAQLMIDEIQSLGEQS